MIDIIEKNWEKILLNLKQAIAVMLILVLKMANSVN